MSHKQVIEVNIDNREALLEALKEMGYKVREGKHTLCDFDWTIQADISILTQDDKQLNIGFIQQQDGSYKIEADFWRTGINQKDFQEQINVLHAKHKTVNWLSTHGYGVTFETDMAGELVVVGTQW
jgi:hypothetical protein